jgi:predicted RNase H-like nuclease
MRVAGADVWKGRWVVVVLHSGQFHRAFVADSIEEPVTELADAVVIGVDMPIGLPDAGERRPARIVALTGRAEITVSLGGTLSDPDPPLTA